jgi:copper chaperone
MLHDMANATFTVRGMSCGHCVTAVSAELLRVPGVERVQVDLAAGQVTVETAGPLSATAITAAIDEAGYEVAP